VESFRIGLFTNVIGDPQKEIRHPPAGMLEEDHPLYHHQQSHKSHGGLYPQNQTASFTRKIHFGKISSLPSDDQ
jgi:hypothetical protein